MSPHVPLLAPKHISQFTPADYKSYIVGLWIDPATTKKAKAKAPAKPFTYAVNKLGSLVVRCKRDPKVVSREELDEFALAMDLTALLAWAALRTRKIKVVKALPKQKTVKIQ